MLELEIKQVREALGKALDAARALGAKMREDPDKAAEHQEAFDKAFEDVKKHQKALQNLEAQVSVEEQHREYNETRSPVRHAGPNPGETAAQAKERMDALHKHAFDTYLRHGPLAAIEVMDEGQVGPQEQNLLLGKKADLGGFLVPDDFRAELMRDVAGLSSFRAAGARVVPTSLRVLTYPTLATGDSNYPTDMNKGTTQTSSNWKTEGYKSGGAAPDIQTKPTFGQENIPTHIWQPDAVELTRELIDDSVVPLDSLIVGLLGEIRGLDETWAFTLGDGVDKPEGIVNAGLTSAVTAASKTAILYEEIIDVFTGLPEQYRGPAKWMCASTTLAALLKMQDAAGATAGTGAFIIPPMTVPGTLMGKPIVINEFVPAIAAGAICLYFGDWSKYVIAERQDIRIQRLLERFAPNVGILATARVGGQIVRTAPFRTLTMLS